jgi:hypothetical protein
MTSNRSVSEMVERIMREIDAQANTRPTGEGLVYSYGEVERGIIEALGNQAPSDADVERVAPFEELCIEAYKHGWLEGCTTLLKLPRGQRNELPHMDAMNEGCGTFMGEIWPRLAAAIPSAVASDDVRDALVKAYTAGATEVHACWMAGKAIECMSPDFTEAAHDYASEAVAAIPSDGGVEPQDLGASSGFDPARMTMFLEILSAAGGEADASESSWNWINAFLEEHEKRYPDTFNEAIDAGYVDWSHDSDSDNSTIRLTATGRAALKASGEE